MKKSRMPKPHRKNLPTRLQTFPDSETFKIFIGECCVLGTGRSEKLSTILRQNYRELTASQRQFYLRKYDEFTIRGLIIHWCIEKDALSPEKLDFLYSKIRFRSVMKLNCKFNETLFLWDQMHRIFDVIFTSGEEQMLAVMAEKLPKELRDNIFNFNREVKEQRR